MYECFHCGQHAVYWNADFDYEDYGIEGNGIIHHCTCANCGAEIEYYVEIKDKEEEVSSASFEEREWINPWNDRRPMTDDWVLVTANDRNHSYVTLGKFDDIDGIWVWFDDDTEVIAWMPLPDVYTVRRGGEAFGEEWNRQ